MVASKLLIASVAILLLFVGVWADAPTQEEVVEPEDSDSGLRLELEQLRKKIFTLGQRGLRYMNHISFEASVFYIIIWLLLYEIYV